MDAKTLNGIRAIKAEIRAITREIENFPQGIVSDYAYSYPNGVKRVIPLVGMADCSHIRKRLDHKLAELQDKLEEVEDWLDTIGDDEMRVILRLKYRNGMNTEMIGNELGYEGSTIRRKIIRYWQDSHNSQ